MADIGTTLREARMRARIDISEVEASTKIRAKYLRAIENEEWDLLPGPIYARSFLRTYGDYLGLDSRMLIDEFKQRYERPSDQEVRPIASRSRDRDRTPRGPLLPPWALIGLVLLAVVAALFIVGLGNNKQSSSTTTPVKVPPKVHRVHHRHVAIPAALKRQAVTLQLVPTGAVYVCLVNGKGTQLIPGRIFNSGQPIPTETARKLLLTLGNNSVQMKVDGKPVSVGSSASSIGYLLEPGHTAPLAPSHQPRCL
ncbi:MAG: helix-turn-helix domain-containing protein [Actinomycetota bacterium]|nr:helix-turn-helix domain-containing protein [Actinomycetota bacterium]